MEKLETMELCDLSPEDKLSLIQGLCHRVMCTYSVQDYLEERQQIASELWYSADFSPQSFALDGMVLNGSRRLQEKESSMSEGG